MSHRVLDFHRVSPDRRPTDIAPRTTQNGGWFRPFPGKFAKGDVFSMTVLTQISPCVNRNRFEKKLGWCYKTEFWRPGALCRIVRTSIPSLFSLEARSWEPRHCSRVPHCPVDHCSRVSLALLFLHAPASELAFELNFPICD